MLASSSEQEQAGGCSSSASSAKRQKSGFHGSALWMLVTEVGCQGRLLEEAVRRRGGGKKLVFAQYLHPSNSLDLVLSSENAQQELRDLCTIPPLLFLSASSEQPSNRPSDTAAALVRLLKACKSREAQSVPADNWHSQIPQRWLSEERTTDIGILSFPLARRIIKLTVRKRKGTPQTSRQAEMDYNQYFCANTINPPVFYAINGARHKRKCRSGLLGAADAMPANNGCRRLEKLKKDSRVTELPDVKVCNAEKQKARPIRWYYVPSLHEAIDDSNTVILLVFLVLDARDKSVEFGGCPSSDAPAQEAAFGRHRAKMMATEETRRAEYLRKDHIALPASELQTAQARLELERRMLRPRTCQSDPGAPKTV
ncbi:hypothetical protein BU15DRAFT_68825 [Melanogaster broomeanus]|nr:hypothetical protein BU15DRAFT_68825 [Melanogaster broomeanus]